MEPNVANVGYMGIASALKDPVTAETICGERQFVNTGGSGLTLDEVKRRIEGSGIVPNHRQ
jgi:hypothetical protein